MRRWDFAAVTAAAFIALSPVSIASAQLIQFSPQGQFSPQRLEFSGGVYHMRACPPPIVPGIASCHAHVVTDSGGRFLARAAATTGLPNGYGPTQLRAAYNVLGRGDQTMIIAVVDAYGDPNAEADLAAYRAKYGLSVCSTANGCFGKYNENGVRGSYPALTSSQFGWAQETALDLDMVSAVCPGCKIVLVEASSSNYFDLAAAENTAAALGAHAISNSYGGCELGSRAYMSGYNHPGVGITASTGDQGYNSGVCGSQAPNDNAEFPATSPDVTAVGGTSLRTASNTRGWTETAWSGGGSGCSKVYSKPQWQKDTLCTMRMEADVSAVADPGTPVAVYGPTSLNSSTGVVTSAWLQFGGTSVAAPIVAALFGDKEQAVVLGRAYRQLSGLNDITSGSNGSCGGTYFCTSGPGYDGPTGLGSPNSALAF
jgi:subtilase family serine protease